MTRKTIAALLLQADATLPDNNTEEISPADVRNMVKDLIDSFKPGYAGMSIDGLTIIALGITPRVITYTDTTALTSEFTVVQGAGSITRLAQGLPSTVTRLTFFASVIAPTGDELVFSLFRDGVSIPGGITVSGRGGNNPSECTMEIINANMAGTDPVYDIRVTKISGGADDVDILEARFIAEVVPTLGI